MKVVKFLFKYLYKIRHEFNVVESSRNVLVETRAQLTINVMLSNGKNITLKVLQTDKPSDVKRYIESVKGTNLDNQKLMQGQVELHDDKSLLESNIMNGTLMRMVQEPEIGNA